MTYSYQKKKSLPWASTTPMLLAGMVAAGCAGMREQQAQVDAEYARLYTEVKSAKELAEKEGKVLTVLLGEQHVSGFSYLHKMLVVDIARRLGIADVIEEIDVPRFPDMAQKMIQNRGSESRSMVDISNLRLLVELNALKQNPDRRLAALEPVVASSEALDHIRSAMPLLVSAMGSDEVRRKYPNTEYAPNCFEKVLQSGKFNCHAGDKERYDKQAIDKFLQDMADRREMDQEEVDRRAAALVRGRQDPVVENAMVETVRDFPRHSVAVYGAAHLPVLVEGLQRAGNKKLLAYDINQQDAGQFSDLVRSRLERNAALAKENKLTRLVLEGSEPSYEMATRMALLASMHYRAASGEIDPKVAGLFGTGLAIVSKLANEQPQLGR